jgi:hypothetical protein
MARILAFGTVIVGALVVADLWAHYKVTNKLIGAGVTESRLIAGKR